MSEMKSLPLFPGFCHVFKWDSRNKAMRYFSMWNLELEIRSGKTQFLLQIY